MSLSRAGSLSGAITLRQIAAEISYSYETVRTVLCKSGRPLTPPERYRDLLD